MDNPKAKSGINIQIADGAERLSSTSVYTATSRRINSNSLAVIRRRRLPKIRINDHEEFDSAYEISTISGISGLVLESWGPSYRNPDYAKAMELILSRLDYFGVPSINVYAVSRNLTNAYPNIDDRIIKIDSSSNILLGVKTPEEIRIDIGRVVGELKEDPKIKSKGGNRFKRLLLHSPLVSAEDWERIASNSIKTTLLAPINDSEKLDTIVGELLKKTLTKPAGNEHPKQCEVTCTSYFRDPWVKAWVLQNAKGTCEACSSLAPFKRNDGSAYLEVHHVLPLAEGGSDTVENTIAVCPNCHRELHFGNNKKELKGSVIEKTARLKLRGVQLNTELNQADGWITSEESSLENGII